jgi:colanic acid biosynthesis protein WcaH
MIPKKLFGEILSCMPITGIEAMVMSGSAVLLTKRRNEPARGEWWFPGGRLRKGETFKAALHREVREETGLEIETVRFIGVYNRMFPERHDVTLVFLCKAKPGDAEVKLNNEHSEYRFFKELPGNLNPFIMEVIQDSQEF